MTGRKRPAPLLAVLALGSGATDAFSFVALGRVFTSVMTGNLVVLGIAIGSGRVTELAGGLIAITCYALGVAATSRYLADRDDGPITSCLAVVALLQAGVLIGWLITATRPPVVLRDGLLALSALAMGTQSAAVRSVVSANVSTTYLTGTLTSLLAGVATGGWRREHVRHVGVLVAVLAGAALDGLLLWAARPVAPALPLVATGTALLTVRVAGSASAR